MVKYLESKCLEVSKYGLEHVIIHGKIDMLKYLESRGLSLIEHGQNYEKISIYDGFKC